MRARCAVVPLIFVCIILCAGATSVWADAGEPTNEEEPIPTLDTARDQGSSSLDVPNADSDPSLNSQAEAPPGQEGGVAQVGIELPTLGSLGMVAFLGLVVALSLRRIRKSKGL